MLFTSISHLDSEKIYQLVRRNIYSSRIIKTVNVTDNDIHHNTQYKYLSNVLKYGILSFNEMVKRRINHDNKQAIDNVNGYDGISVSKVVEIYPSEDFYDANCVMEPDLIIDEEFAKNHHIYRNSINYGNEFIVKDHIPVEYIKLITIRFLEYFNISWYNRNLDGFIQMYNYLIDSLERLEELGIDLVDNSEEEIVIDKKKLLSYGKLKK